MNRFLVVLAIAIATCAVVASAHGGGSIELEELEGGHFGHGGELGGLGGLGGGFGGGIGRGHGLFRGVGDEILLEELSRRRLLGRGGRFGSGGLGGGIGSGGIGSGGSSGGIGRGFRRGQGFGHGLGPAVGGLGAIGGASEGSIGALGASTRLGDSSLAEGAKGGLIAGSKNLDIGNQESVHSSNGGLHKHQVLNNDKTIIRDRTTGVNDVDSFQNSAGSSSGNRFSSGSSGLAAAGAGGRLENSKHLNSDIGAIGAQHGDIEGAAGAAGGIF